MLLPITGLFILFTAIACATVHAQTPAPSETGRPDTLVDVGLERLLAGPKLLEYLVGCALTSEQHLRTPQQGVELTGSMGLAPAWRERALTIAERRWLSACLLARMNAFGERVLISMRGGHPALRRPMTARERLDYRFEEAAFYGDLFADAPNGHVCRGRAGPNPPPTRALRVCSDQADADGMSRCGMIVTGDCDAVCTRGADGTLSACRAADGAYAEVVAVYLRTR